MAANDKSRSLLHYCLSNKTPIDSSHLPSPINPPCTILLFLRATLSILDLVHSIVGPPYGVGTLKPVISSWPTVVAVQARACGDLPSHRRSCVSEVDPGLRAIVLYPLEKAS